ncbi:MAG: hypothetical protein DI599_14070 [Pseudomonas kuykendallii]|uniref:Uncharacterized protein n=1 Tax=Pseudomonas kuykendallii TaxID=1007099 RepID=A0A2W5EZU5_9PSED|nr:MAG: hypothetical protein DI599_14070 [Pseudomonas kuykendallii]
MPGQRGRVRDDVSCFCRNKSTLSGGGINHRQRTR